MASSSKKQKTNFDCFMSIGTQLSQVKAKLLDMYSGSIRGKSLRKVAAFASKATAAHARYGSVLDPIPPAVKTKRVHRRIPSMPTLGTAKAQWKDQQWTDRRRSRKAINQFQTPTFKFERFPVIDAQKSRKHLLKLDVEVPQPPPNSDVYSPEPSQHAPTPIQVFLDIPRTIDMRHPLVSPIVKREDAREYSLHRCDVTLQSIVKCLTTRG